MTFKSIFEMVFQEIEEEVPVEMEVEAPATKEAGGDEAEKKEAKMETEDKPAAEAPPAAEENKEQVTKLILIQISVSDPLFFFLRNRILNR